MRVDGIMTDDLELLDATLRQRASTTPMNLRTFTLALGPCLLGLACGDAPEVAWPLSGDAEPDPISSPFGPRDQSGRYDFHAGVDFRIPEGTKVRAIKAGVVEKLVDDTSSPGPGKWLLIDHGAGEKSAYLHLSTFSTKAGASVDAGEVIGRSGSTGASTPHLHLNYLVDVESKDGSEAYARNPLELLPHPDMPTPTASFDEDGLRLRLAVFPMTVQTIALSGPGGSATLDYADIVALGNPSRDVQLQAGVHIDASKPEDGYFDLSLRGDGWLIDSVTVYDYAGEILLSTG